MHADAQTKMSFFDPVGWILLCGPFFLIAVICKLSLWIKVIYMQKPSLAAVPGPWWAAWTRLWIVKTLASGKSAQIFADTNRRYGQLARIGPNHVLTSDPEVTRRILSASSGYKRAPWFDSIRIDPKVPNIVSERDSKKHGQLKHKLASCFTPGSISAMEPVMDERVRDWIDRVKTLGSKGSFDIARRIQFLTVDIITQICLGAPLGCVAADEDKFKFLQTVETGNVVCQHLSVLLELNSLVYYLAKIPLLERILVPKAGDETGVGRIMGLVQKALREQDDNDEEKQSGTMLNRFLEKGVPRSQVDAEIVIALVAGSDTTSTSVQSTLLAIASHPTVYSRLKQEIAAAVSQGVSYPVKHTEAANLRFLQACILEGLRVFPPLSQLREREVPAGGDMISGYRVPGGTFIGLDAWGTQQNAGVYGEDAAAFRPERWLIDDEEQLKRMLQTHSLIFGYGPTKCIGVSMAKMELEKIIFEIFRNFEVSIANPYQPWSSKCYGIFFQKDFNVYLRPVQAAVAQDL